ncbi:MAG: DUF6455 family protein [Pseudomonadota bacterium]
MKAPLYQDWLDRFEARLSLRRRAMKALGVALPARPDKDTQEILRQTLITCTTCDHARPCAAWLELGDTFAGPPAFCPNRDRYLRLLARRRRKRMR